MFGTLSGRVSPWTILLGALALLVPFLPATSTFFISDDIVMVLFGATTSAAEIDWLPSSAGRGTVRCRPSRGSSRTP